MGGFYLFVSFFKIWESFQLLVIDWLQNRRLVKSAWISRYLPIKYVSKHLGFNIIEYYLRAQPIIIKRLSSATTADLHVDGKGTNLKKRDGS